MLHEKINDQESEDNDFREVTFYPNTGIINNKISHQKYEFYNLIPKFLFEQFSNFFNFFYLIVTLTQVIPALRIGFLITYISPLLFVLGISFIKEMWDEYNVMKRDNEINSKEYSLITGFAKAKIKSKDILVGHIIEVNPRERVPADLILLKTNDDTGSTFIKTDQLDGETDWKLKRSLGCTQGVQNLFDLKDVKFEIEKPQTSIYDFNGRVIINGEVHSIGIESTVWCDTVVASNKIIGLVIYTGNETRSSMNASKPSLKIGVFEKELNMFCSILFIILFTSALFFSICYGVSNIFPIILIRFVLLFSYIIPISMRVNLDVAKVLYGLNISKDNNIEGTVLRNSNIPEELGRIQFLFTDKTGTLTQNDMEFKKLQYDNIVVDANSKFPPHPMSFLALALCHCVSVSEEGFQASSPDEIAFVKHASKVGYKLINRNDNLIEIELENGNIEKFNILALLPFSSIWSHMSIVLQNEKYGNIIISKGSDTSMKHICKQNEWVEEVVGNLAREGLRTLVFGFKPLDDNELQTFLESYQIASSDIVNRSEKILESFKTISHDMTILGVTGIEDKLQDNVPETLEALEAAKIKTWMLTGDKMETAICVARASRIFQRNTEFRIIDSLSEIVGLIDKPNVPSLVINGKALQVPVLPSFFFGIALKSPSVVIYRCSPSQKEKVVKEAMKNNIISCAIGDGGNDVSMIRASSIGIGIVGKEGKQASLAADVSINSFSQIQSLLFWHGANFYRHSSRLSQVIIHRGMLIAVAQAIYSSLFGFIPSSFYSSWLLMGFSTFHTSLPVITLISDYFLDHRIVIEFPELYVKCQKGRYLSKKTFMKWIFLSIYQNIFIVYIPLKMFQKEFIDVRHIQSLSYTILLFTELLLIGIVVNHLNKYIILSIISSIILYILTILILPDVLDLKFIFSIKFFIKFQILLLCCLFPLIVERIYHKKCSPTQDFYLQYE